MASRFSALFFCALTLVGAATGLGVPVARADSSCSPDYAFMGSQPLPGGGATGGIYIRTQCGTRQLQLTTNPAGNPDAMPALSPDGSRVAFVRDFGTGGTADSDIWMIPSAGGDAVQITHTHGLIESPNWSPDGRSLVFENRGLVYIVAADGTGLQEVLTGWQPTWCGNLLVFMWMQHLYTANPDGSGATQITSGFKDNWPTCSPDDNYVFYQHESNSGQFGIDVVAITGGTPSQVVTAASGYAEGKPAVSGDWTLGYMDMGAGPSGMKLQWLGGTAATWVPSLDLSYMDSPTLAHGDGSTPPPAGLQLPVGLPAPLPLLSPSPSPATSPAPSPTPSGGLVSSNPEPSAAGQKAVAWAKAQVGAAKSQELHHYWSGWCEAFVEIAYGTRHRYVNALADYKTQKDAGRIHTDANPPAGALVFYGGGRDGHVALSIGNGMVVTTWGYIGQRYPIREVKVRGFSNPYYGWAYPPTNWPGR